MFLFILSGLWHSSPDEEKSAVFLPGLWEVCNYTVQFFSFFLLYRLIYLWQNFCRPLKKNEIEAKIVSYTSRGVDGWLG